MQDIDTEFDLRLEKQQEAEREAKIEAGMRRDLKFCIEQLGIDDAINDLDELVDQLKNYGHKITLAKIINER